MHMYLYSYLDASVVGGDANLMSFGLVTGGHAVPSVVETMDVVELY